MNDIQFGRYAKTFLGRSVQYQGKFWEIKRVGYCMNPHRIGGFGIQNGDMYRIMEYENDRI